MWTGDMQSYGWLSGMSDIYEPASQYITLCTAGGTFDPLKATVYFKLKPQCPFLLRVNELNGESMCTLCTEHEPK